jgi:hypothetical protein
LKAQSHLHLLPLPYPSHLTRSVLSRFTSVNAYSVLLPRDPDDPRKFPCWAIYSPPMGTCTPTGLNNVFVLYSGFEDYFNVIVTTFY